MKDLLKIGTLIIDKKNKTFNIILGYTNNDEKWGEYMIWSNSDNMVCPDQVRSYDEFYEPE